MFVRSAVSLASQRTAKITSSRYLSQRWVQNTSSGSSIPTAVQVVEVGPRDGLQNEKAIVSVSDKVTLIEALIDAGCNKIEAGSFVSPKWVPNMANSGDVMKELSKVRDENNDLRLSCLVPSAKYLQQALEVNPDEIAIFGSASEAFSQKNINCSIQESMERFRDVMDAAENRDLPVRGYLSCVIACPYQGPIAPSETARVTEMMLELGCYEVSLGDTIGVGTPASVGRMLDAVLSSVDSDLLAVHFHDTYGQGLVNILTSLDRGIATVDSSVAGLGGCPYAKGASGNVATEDVVYMLDGLGISTGIDLDKLVDAAEFICNVLGRPSSSKAGTAIATKRRET